jgi:hypothetical protein
VGTSSTSRAARSAAARSPCSPRTNFGSSVERTAFLLGQWLPAVEGRLRPAGDDPGRRYALAALAEELARVAAAPKGQRNRQLWESTRNLYNLVATGALHHHVVHQGLLQAAERNGLLAEEPRQTRRTLASGRQVGLAHPGRPAQPTSPERAHPSPTPPPLANRERTQEGR